MEKRRPFARPYRIQLVCCSPDRHAWQFARIHGARRKLSEPRIAGKASAAWLSNQRLTSTSDSVLFMRTCVLSRTYCQEESELRNMQETPKFRCYPAF